MGDKLFEIMRFNILTAALNPATRRLLGDAYVYAWDRKVYPVDHRNERDKPFAASFDVTEEMMDELGKFLEERWRGKNVPTFYQLEDYYHIREPGTAGSPWDRISLMHACRYLKLAEWFDSEFWSRLLAPTEHPSEASSIAQPYDRKKDLFLL
jgi:hypothetical protein